MAFSEYPIHLDQICEGLYIRYEGSDARGSLLTSRGLKIKDQSQIDAIKKTGVKHVICVLNKSDRLPIPIGDEEVDRYRAGTQAEYSTPVSKQLFGLKKETIDRNLERKQQFAKYEKQYDNTVSDVATLLRRASAKADDAVVEAQKVVDRLVDTFLSDRDVLVSLMTNKPKEEKQHLHAFNVTVLSMMLGKELNLDEETMRYLGMGALFHDMGKGRMPVSELSRGKATTLRYAVQRYYEQHPQMGAQIAADLPNFPKPSIHIILQHHETIDGKGFPNKLPGNKISPLAKIMAIANVYDNLCNKVDVQKRLTPHEALKHLFSKGRVKLDNRYLAMFIRILGVYPPGTVVHLSNGAMGMVVTTNMHKPARPSVMIYHPDVPRREALIVDLVIEEKLEIKKSISPQDLPREVFNYLSPTRQISYYAEASSEG